MEAVAAISEVIAWMGLLAAAIFGFAALALRVARGPWDTAPAAQADGELRWMSADGSFHSAPAIHPDSQQDDDFVIHYRTRRPDVCYIEKVAHDERALRLVALSLAGVGVLAVILNLIATFL